MEQKRRKTFFNVQYFQKTYIRRSLIFIVSLTLFVEKVLLSQKHEFGQVWLPLLLNFINSHCKDLIKNISNIKYLCFFVVCVIYLCVEVLNPNLFAYARVHCDFIWEHLNKRLNKMKTCHHRLERLWVSNIYHTHAHINTHTKKST